MAAAQPLAWVIVLISSSWIPLSFTQLRPSQPASNNHASAFGRRLYPRFPSGFRGLLQARKEETEADQFIGDEFSDYVRSSGPDVDPFGFNFGQDLNSQTLGKHWFQMTACCVYFVFQEIHKIEFCLDPDSKFHASGNPEDSVAYGPDAVLLAGFSLDEIIKIRYLTHEINRKLKVVPVSDPMLEGSLEAALEVEEPDLQYVAQMSPELLRSNWTERAIIFGGIPWASQIKILELMDHSWEHEVPFVVLVAANVLNKDLPLQEVLSNALEEQVKAGMDAPQPLQEVHEESGLVRSWRESVEAIRLREPDPIEEARRAQEFYDKNENVAIDDLEDY
eukprot:jgi/Bigna1/68487/fgenesh1_pg.6_\